MEEWTTLLVPIALLMVNLINRALTRQHSIDYLIQENEELDALLTKCRRQLAKLRKDRKP